MNPADIDVPPEALQALIAIWRDQRHIHLSLRPGDAWMTVAIVQFAARNPALSPEQREIAERVGRALQGALAQLSPIAAEYLEMGWNPAYDRPRGDV
jgi:hypothetical protein